MQNISKEALFYSIYEDKVICNLCPHQCNLENGQYGNCRTRINIDNKLFANTFNKVCAIAIDPIEKKPLYHFFPNTKTLSFATSGCNLRCLNCQNQSISQKYDYEVKYNIMSSQEIVNHAIKNKCHSISYTYTEPTAFYEYCLETAKLAKKYDLKNVIVSAGYINQKPLINLLQYIDAANIDLKSFDNDTYKKLNNATLIPVLKTIKTIAQHNIWLEITNLIIPKWTDNLDNIKKMCQWFADNDLQHIPIHFSKFSPNYKLTNIQTTNFDIFYKIHEIATNEGLKYVYIGNIEGNNYENTFCDKCNKLLIKRNGYNILENRIAQNKCPFCENNIYGKWK